MTTLLVPTLGRFAKGYPEHADAGPAKYVPLSEALTTAYPDDRHFAAYSLPSVPYRISGPKALELGPAMVLFVVDVDSTDPAERPKVARLLEDHPGGYVYTTKGGYRLVYRIPPISLRSNADKEKWTRTYRAWLAYLADRYEIAGDPKCSDWTRLYRLPRVVRNGVRQEPETAGDPAAIGTWNPDVEVPEESAPEPAPTFEGMIPDGQRNAALTSLGGSMRHRGMGEKAILAALLVENSEKCNPPLPESDVQTIAASVARYDPELDVAEDAQLRDAISALDDPEWAEVLERARADLMAYRGSTSDGGGKLARPAFSPASELFDRTFPPTAWLVQGLLTEKSVGVTSAEPKSCKTWAELELDLAVATGTPAFGEFDVPMSGHVALFLAEDHERSVRNRLRALAAARGIDPRWAARRVHVACRSTLDLKEDSDLVWIIASCRMIPGLLLVEIDPLRDVHTGDENDSAEMADVMGRLRAIRDIVGCAVRFVHHSGKAGQNTGKRRSGQMMRGSGAIHGAVDCGLYLDGLDTDGQSKWSSDVSVEIKAAQGAGRFSLELEVQDDEAGEAVRATWRVDKGGTSEVSEADSIKLLAVIKEFGHACNWSDIRRRAGLGNDRATEVRMDLEAAGKIRKHFPRDADGKRLPGTYYEVAAGPPAAAPPALPGALATKFLPPGQRNRSS